MSMLDLAGSEIAVSVISLVMILGGFVLVWNTSRYSNNMQLNQRVIEVLGLCFILPVLMLGSIEDSEIIVR